MTSAFAADGALSIARIERAEALRQLAYALTDVPYAFSLEEVEEMQALAETVTAAGER